MVLPLGMKRVELIEIPGHVGLLALGQPWMTVEHYADLMTACCLANDLSEKDARIRELSQRGVSMLVNNTRDYDELRHVIGTLIQWLSTQSNVKIYNATKQRLKKLDEQERLLARSGENDLQLTS